MHLITHLTFNGACKLAFTLYQECLGGSITMFTYSSAQGISVEPGLEDKIFHATLKVADQVLTGVDLSPDAYKEPQGFAVQLNLDEPAEAQRIFDCLAEGGVVHMPLQKTSWAGHYATFTDRFGTPWEINCA